MSFVRWRCQSRPHCLNYDEARGHRPSEFSSALQQRIAELPRPARSFFTLAVDAAKRFEVCPNSQERIGNRLKGVHVILLAMAWWKTVGWWRYEPESCDVWRLTVEFFHWLHLFEFERCLVKPFEDPSFAARAAAPSGRDKGGGHQPIQLFAGPRLYNLAWEVDADG